MCIKIIVWFYLDVIVNVTDDVEVGMILGGWEMEQPILIRSDGIVCSKNDTQDGDRINVMPKYPKVDYILQLYLLLSEI